MDRDNRTGSIERLRSLARVQDELFRIPGTRIRFGLDALIGLIPGAGDVFTSCVSVYVLLEATRMGASPSVIARMAGNILLDLLFGWVPLLGDVFDVGWKANVRNVRLLEKFVVDPRGVRRGSRVMLVVSLLVIFGVLAGLAWVAVLVIRRLLSGT